jgi:hypothetical protein
VNDTIVAATEPRRCAKCHTKRLRLDPFHHHFYGIVGVDVVCDRCGWRVDLDDYAAPRRRRRWRDPLPDLPGVPPGVMRWRLIDGWWRATHPDLSGVTGGETEWEAWREFGKRVRHQYAHLVLDTSTPLTVGAQREAAALERVVADWRDHRRRCVAGGILWERVKRQMKADGEDVDGLIEQAAANLTYWHDHPSTDTEAMPDDLLEPDGLQITQIFFDVDEDDP